MPRSSGASVWVFCPGAPTLWAVLPPSESDIAREGTAAHWVGEQTFMSAFEGEELIDRPAPNGVFVTEKMINFVNLYTREVQLTIA